MLIPSSWYTRKRELEALKKPSLVVGFESGTKKAKKELFQSFGC
jgi:hypothetical protein